MEQNSQSRWPSGPCYLAGPMRRCPDYNFPAFFAAEEALVADGVEVYSPARYDQDILGFKWQGTTGLEPPEFLAERGVTIRKCLEADLGYICTRAKWLCVLPGWESSSGVKAEIACALAIGIPIVEFATGAVIKPSLEYLVHECSM